MLNKPGEIRKNDMHKLSQHSNLLLLWLRLPKQRDLLILLLIGIQHGAGPWVV